jgi:hypothetical protein
LYPGGCRVARTKPKKIAPQAIFLRKFRSNQRFARAGQLEGKIPVKGTQHGSENINFYSCGQQTRPLSSNKTFHH